MSANYTVTLADDVRDVLLRSTITESALTLPQQLDRKLYDRVMKVIDAAGGKWNRKAKSHVFSRDPREALGLAVESGKIVNQAKALNQFFTPPDLAQVLAQKLEIRPGMTVLEPSAGAGALADAARRAGGTVFCVEIDELLVEELRAKGHAARCADFMQLDPNPYEGTDHFDAVIMNPPFVAGQDIAHILHAYKFLRPGGVLAAIAGAGVTFRKDKAHVAFRDWVDILDGSIEPLPEGSFKEADTNVSTVLVIVRKPGGAK